MSIFKRIEVWLLLVLSMAGLVYVLLNQQEDVDGRSPQTAPSTRPTAPADPAKPADDPVFEPGGQLEVKGVRVDRNGDEYLAEVTFNYDNQGDRTLRTIDDARLITASGKSVPVFFLAFTGAPPELPAKQKSTASVRFELAGEDIIGELHLDIGGQRKPIKSPRSFDPEAIASRGSKTFNSPDW